MSERAPTLHDVARDAGVSTATVSRVLNGGPVSPNTASLVQDVVARLGYVPNQVARGLVTGRSNVFGVLIPDLVGPLNAAIARGVEDALEQRGMHAVIMTDHREAEREANRVAALVARRVDGLVLIGSQLDDDTLYESIGTTPVVHVGAETTPNADRYPEIRIDNSAGMAKALEALKELGHKEIAHLAGPRRDGKERREALLKLAPQYGITITHVLDTDFSEEGGLEAGRSLLANDDFTAVVCANDRAAAGLYIAARERQLRLPQDLSVIGFDDLPWSSYLSPPLATLSQPAREMGRLAAECVLAPEEHEAWRGTRTLDPAFIARDSLASPPT